METHATFQKDIQYYKFCLYGFLKNLRFFEPFFMLILLDKGMSYTQIGTLYGIREITRNILEIPAGIMADALGRRRTLATSFLFYILSFVIFFLGRSYIGFVLAMLVYSLGDAFRTGTHKAMIFTYLKLKGWENDKVHYYGYTRSWSQFGSAISALVAAGIVIYTKSYTYVFLFSIIPYLFDFMLMLTYPKELEGDAHMDGKRNIREAFSEVGRDFILSFKNRHVLRSIANTSVFSGFFQAVKDYLQPVLKSWALAMPIFMLWEKEQRSALIIGVVYFILYFLTSAASRASGKIAGKFSQVYSPLNMTLIVGILLGIMAGGFYAFSMELPAILLFMGIFLLENLRKPMGMGYVTDVLEKDILATALSAESQIKSLFAAIFAVIIGVMSDVIGVGWALVFISVILMLFYPFYMAKKKR